MGTNAETLREATPAEKENEKTFVKTTATISRGEDSNKKVNKNTLAQLLDKYVGEGKTIVTQKSTTRLVVRFLETGDEYEIDIDTASIAYTVTYDANGGAGAPEPQTKYDGIDLKLSEVIPSKTERLFVGWDTKQKATEAIYQPGDIYTDDSSITLYAVFKEDVTATFMRTENDPHIKQRYYNNGIITNPTFTFPNGTDSDFSGWTWRGWSPSGVTTANAEVKYANGDNITVTEDNTFYGLQRKLIKLQYDGNGRYY